MVVRRRKKRVRFIEHTSIKAGKVTLRSGWELEYLTWLDENPDVVAVGYETLVITYVTGVRRVKARRYFPDFVITWADGRKEIVEIKPSNKMKNKIVIKKAIAATAYALAHGMTYVFVTEVELKKLGLLKPKKKISAVVEDSAAVKRKKSLMTLKSKTK